MLDWLDFFLKWKNAPAKPFGHENFIKGKF